LKISGETSAMPSAVKCTGAPDSFDLAAGQALLQPAHEAERVRARLRSARCAFLRQLGQSRHQQHRLGLGVASCLARDWQ